MLPNGPRGYIPPGYKPGLMWAKQDHNGKVVWACHCGCHEGEVRPPATEAMLCSPCADEAFTPWIDTLEAML